MTLHGSHITNFCIIQTVYTFSYRIVCYFCGLRTSWQGLICPQNILRGFKLQAHSVLLIYLWAACTRSEFYL